MRWCEQWKFITLSPWSMIMTLWVNENYNKMQKNCSMIFAVLWNHVERIRVNDGECLHKDDQIGFLGIFFWIWFSWRTIPRGQMGFGPYEKWETRSKLRKLIHWKWCRQTLLKKENMESWDFHGKEWIKCILVENKNRGEKVVFGFEEIRSIQVVPWNWFHWKLVQTNTTKMENPEG